MSFLQSFLAAMPQTILGVVATLALRSWLTRPRFNAYVTPMAEIAWNDPNGVFDRFRIESLVFVNGSKRKAVDSIRVTMAFRPAAISVNPPLHHTTEDLDRGRHCLIIDRVQPGQLVKVDVFYLGKFAPEIQDISTSEGPKHLKQANFAPAMTQWVQTTFVALAAIGVVTLVAGVVWAVSRLAILSSG